jgi:hypothetical protein
MTTNIGPRIVAPLVWEALDSSGGYFRAAAPLFGTIRIERLGVDRPFFVSWSVPGFCAAFIKGEFPTVEAAKAAAQADYAARIIAALDPAALAAMLADARANALREAAATAYRVCAETRHVTLGRAAEAATLALIDKEPQT